MRISQCEFLSKSDWPLMEQLDLYNGHIGSEGVVHLRKAHWPLLESIKLSIFPILKTTIQSETRAADSYA